MATTGISHREVIVAFNQVFADILRAYFKPSQSQQPVDDGALPSFIPNHDQLDGILADPYSSLGESAHAYAALLQIYKNIQDQRSLSQQTIQALAETANDFRVKHLSSSQQLKDLINEFSNQLDEQRQQIQQHVGKLDEPESELKKYQKQINKLTNGYEQKLKQLRQETDAKLSKKIKELGHDLGIQAQQDFAMTSRYEIMQRYQSLNIDPPAQPEAGSKEDYYYESLAKLQLVFRSLLMMEAPTDE